MKRILALDMSSQCGWAFQSEDGSIASGVTPFLGTLNPGHRWLRFDQWLNLPSFEQLNLIVYEEPIVHFKHRNGLGFGYGFEAILRLHCARKEIRCEGVNISTLKKWSTGDGRADKFKMVRFARQIKPDVSDDNEADAILLLEYARKRILKLKGGA
jgi:crossover junction endodeoxyribonuclease RuvC